MPTTKYDASLAIAQQDFAGALYRAALDDVKGNMALSPTSVHIALGMTLAGARGQTAAQMRQTLQLAPTGEVQAAFGEEHRAWSWEGPGELAVANRVWADQGLELLPSYVQVLDTTYGGAVEVVDFANATEPARKRINEWVSEQTRARIPELLAPDTVRPDTTLVLTNAVYFLGAWSKPFDKRRTQPLDFHNLDGSVAQVPMMTQTSQLRVAETADALVLELPYAGERFAMLLALPGSTEALPRLEASLGSDAFASWRRGLQTERVRVQLPRFRIETLLELSPALKELGMTDAFGAADFSGMSASGGQAISKVVHQVFLDVNEQGTEAAAATAVVVGRSAALEQPLAFIADRPFVVVLWDKSTEAPLFVGRVVGL